jgi:two-component system cell cycle sensor histidine kinase/response regulator CckA
MTKWHKTFICSGRLVNNLPLRQSELHMEYSRNLSAPPRTVLLVDDEEFLRRLLARLLDQAGFAVVQAENGSAALQAAQVVDSESLSLVVTDINMPLMNGIEFARELRPLHPKVPLLFITGRDPVDGDDPASVNGYLLRKPFRGEAFLATIEQLLNGRPQPQRLGESLA